MRVEKIKAPPKEPIPPAEPIVTDRVPGQLVSCGGKSSPSTEQCLTLSAEQEAARDAIADWFSSRRSQTFYLDGPAGVGKTTLVKHIADWLGGTVEFAAFTNKAAAVMRSKGCRGASTIDSLVYHPKIETSCKRQPPCDDPAMCGCRYMREYHVGRELNKQSRITRASLVIIDEVSMVDEKMARDLISFDVPVLVLGDRAQLPPIQGEGYFTRGTPDFQLTEIHRQAAGSPVIALATLARRGLELPRGQHGDSFIGTITYKEAAEFDQVIVGLHVTRHLINYKIRRVLGFGGEVPQRGEKLICLKNSRGKGLLNGTIWMVEDVGRAAAGFVEMTVVGEEGKRVDVRTPLEGFTVRNGSGLPGDVFAFGYAITCHKAQGSQWGSVAIKDESFYFREHRRHWLYTAITRAADRVSVTP